MGNKITYLIIWFTMTICFLASFIMMFAGIYYWFNFLFNIL